MFKALILMAALALGAQAGVLSVATYVVRHPLKSQKAVFTVVSYPVRHPMKTVF